MVTPKTPDRPQTLRTDKRKRRIALIAFDALLVVVIVLMLLTGSESHHSNVPLSEEAVPVPPPPQTRTAPFKTEAMDIKIDILATQLDLEETSAKHAPQKTKESSTSTVEAYESAVAAAKEGTIKYNIADEMEVSTATTARVRIFGAKASSQQVGAFQAKGGGDLKVVPTMLVSLTAPDNPSAFTIAPESGPHTGYQFVPSDGYAEWDWTVTPLQGGPPRKKLHVTAEMVFNKRLPDGTPLRAEIASYDAVVTVKIKPRSEVVKEWFAENWDKLLKYVLPGGAVTTLVVYLLVGRRKKKGERGDDEAD